VIFWLECYSFNALHYVCIFSAIKQNPFIRKKIMSLKTVRPTHFCSLLCFLKQY